MTRPIQNGDFCAGALGTTACERLPADVVVFRRNHRQAGFGGCPGQAGSEIAHHRLSGRSVDSKDCSTQVGVRTSSHFPGDRRGHAQALESLGSGFGRRVRHLRNGLLADFRCLPDLREIMPDVIRIERAQNIARPASYEIGTLDCDAHDVPSAPVMPHEIDRLWQLCQFAGEPVAISINGAVKAGRDGRAKPGRRQTNNAIVAQMRDEVVPDSLPMTVASEGVRGYALDPDTAEALWKKSEELVGESF